MSMSQSTKRVYRTKNRRVTACVECHRRKQRCNRQKPCNNCIGRKLSEKCLYGAYSTTPETTPAQEPAVSSNEIDLNIDQTQLSTLSSKIGYFDGGSALKLNTPATTAITDLQSNYAQRPSSIASILPDTIAFLLDTIPEPEIAMKIVRVFFNEANWYFSVLDQCFFEQRYRKWLQSKRLGGDTLLINCRFFPALLFQVLAIGLHFLPNTARLDPDIAPLGHISFDKRSQEFSEAGASLLAQYRRQSPDLSSIEADIMRCAWLKNTGSGREAWHSLGDAIRQAQDIGLHLEPVTSNHESYDSRDLRVAWDHEHRRRVWGCLVTWDAHMALQLGRPRMINLADCTVVKPKNCDAPSHMTRTIPRTDDLDREIPSTYTSHIVKYDIAVKIHKALDQGLLRRGTSDYAKVGQIDHDIQQLLAQLPPSFVLSDPDTSWDLFYPDIPKLRLQIQIVVDSFLLAVHRPHVLNHAASLRAAIHAAMSVLKLSETFFETLQENQYRTFTVIFYIIDSGIFLALALARDGLIGDSHEVSKKSIAEVLHRSVQQLELLKSYHSAAVTGQTVLQNCLARLKFAPESALTYESYTPPSTHPQTEHASHTEPSSVRDFDVDDEFFASLFQDSAATFAWLEEQWKANDTMIFDDL